MQIGVPILIKAIIIINPWNGYFETLQKVHIFTGATLIECRKKTLEKATMKDRSRCISNVIIGKLICV